MSELAEAEACRSAGDTEGEEKALNRLLEAKPFSVLANIRKAECRARAGDEDLARYFFRNALSFAEAQELPPALAGEVARAEQALRALERSAHLAREARLLGRGLPPETWSPRFRQALEMEAGRKRHYPQRPTSFFYPGLPTVQFYDPAQFAWAAAIEAATPVIRAELDALLARGTDDFRAFFQNDVGTIPLGDNARLLNRKDWSILPFCENGWAVPAVLQSCPRTWQAVLQAPLPRIPGWGPTVVFSLLKAGARIAPHNGMANTRLICHLPLLVPPGCGFRVGNEVREWEVGKLLIFDDSIEHEAWNQGEGDRVVLIFDIWRPELSDQERRELTLLFSD